ncbi:MAG: AI-2E family transporter [Deltaproteobacteria bacterium]|nr:AI-2E family transporter [Deltaproteobacteria bacterium]
MGVAPAGQTNRLATALFFAVFAAVTLLLLRMFAAFVAALVLAAVLVVLFAPVFARLTDLVRGRRTAAAAVTAVIVVLIVVVPVSVMLASLSREVVLMAGTADANDLPVIEQLVTAAQGTSPILVRLRGLAGVAGLDTTPDALRRSFLAVSNAVTEVLYREIGGIASNALRILLMFALMIVVMLALLTDGPRLKAYLLDLSPLPNHQEEMLVSRFAAISRAVFLGNGVASVLQGIAGGLGFVLFDLGSGFVWGAVIAFFAFLPILGAAGVAVPAAAYLYLDGRPGAAVAFLAYSVVYIGVFEYGLKPRLIGGQAKMSGVLIFLAILSGVSLFGLLGLFYGPLVLAMFLTLAEIYKREYREPSIPVERVAPTVPES